MKKHTVSIIEHNYGVGQIVISSDFFLQKQKIKTKP